MKKNISTVRFGEGQTTLSAASECCETMNGCTGVRRNIRLLNNRKRHKGAVVVLAAFMMVVLFAFLAFSVDIGYIATEKAKIQAAADAAALAAIYELPNQAQLDSVAQTYAGLNHPDAGNNLHVTTEAGTWDKDSRTFTTVADLSDANSIRVTVMRVDTPLFFAPLVGTSELDISSSAVAVGVGEGDCFDKGIIAGDTVTLGQDMLLDGYCAYGRNGVSMGQDPVVMNGGMVGALDQATITYGQDPTGLPEAIVEVDKQPNFATDMTQIIDDLLNGVNLPPQITNIVYFPNASHLPNNLSSGTAYIFDESISIDQDYHVADVIIATRKNISWGQDGRINNTSSPDGSSYAIGLYAGENISLGQDAVAYGVNIVAGKDVNIGQDVISFSGSIEAGQKVTISQDPHLSNDWLSAIPQSNQGNSTKSMLVQ